MPATRAVPTLVLIALAVVNGTGCTALTPAVMRQPPKEAPFHGYAAGPGSSGTEDGVGREFPAAREYGEVLPAAAVLDMSARSYHQVRIEGRALSYLVVQIPRYLRKINHPKFYAEGHVEAYFSRQHGWIAREAVRPRPEAGPKNGTASVSVALFGDLMWLREPRPGTVSDDVRAFLHETDVVLGNLETSIDRRRNPTRSSPMRRFNASPELLDLFADARGRLPFTAFSVANNHTLDLGDDGARATTAFLDERGVAHSGLEREDAGRGYVLIERDGLRIGFYAATYGANRRRDRKTRLPLHVVPSLRANGTGEAIGPVERALARMDADGVHVRVVSLHWGHEYEFYPDPKQIRLAHRIVELGADVVLGHHPHVVQPMELCVVNGYPADDAAPGSAACALASEAHGAAPRKALIFYSMGDFLTDKKTHATRLGLLARLRFVPVAPGRWDWRMEQNRVVYTRPAAGRGRASASRLVFADDAAFAPDRAAAPELDALVGFLGRHVPLKRRIEWAVGRSRLPGFGAAFEDGEGGEEDEQAVEGRDHRHAQAADHDGG